MATQAYNVMWIARDFSKQGQALPDSAVTNLRHIAEENPGVDVRLWVDSKRLSEEQMKWLSETCAKNESGTISIRDLRTIAEYTGNNLFDETTSPQDRFNKKSIIWRQVDAARILVSLQGDYEQSFYADLDLTNVKVSSQEVQNKLEEFGMVISGRGNQKGGLSPENQMFSFSKSRKDMFRLLYADTLDAIFLQEDNGYLTFLDMVRREAQELGVKTEDLLVRVEGKKDPELHLHDETRPAFSKSPESE